MRAQHFICKQSNDTGESKTIEDTRKIGQWDVLNALERLPEE